MDSFSLVAAPLIDADDLPAGKLHGVLVAEFVRQSDESHLGVRALDQVLDADAACRARHTKQELAGELDPAPFNVAAPYSRGRASTMPHSPIGSASKTSSLAVFRTSQSGTES